MSNTFHTCSVGETVGVLLTIWLPLTQIVEKQRAQGVDSFPGQSGQEA
jgi:hypothetical protein